VVAQQRRPAAYDDIADWYADYIAGDAAGFTARAGGMLVEMLGRGSGPCWDLACGTGVYADTIRELGWTPVGTDISAGQLRRAARCMPVVLADAAHAPIKPGSLGAVASILCHTDMEDYAGACQAAATALRPGGRFVHVGVHPCFTGAFADWSRRPDVVIGPGYWRRDRRFEAWTPHGVRARVGAVHRPLSDLVAAVVAAGLVLDAVAEFGDPTPDLLAMRAHRPVVAR
jgi:SAM-dependent methyltransferase